jgi:REP element-mobilizing transposase RayT
MRTKTRRREPLRQLTIFRRGGARAGAGRKPVGPKPLVSHARRAKHAASRPVHVTTRLVAGLPSLRNAATLAVLQRAFRAGADRFGFRLVHFSVQANHLHLLVEAEDSRALARGMKGLLVRVARSLNRHWGRRGRVIGDRFHARSLATPREVRAALVYVLQNGRKHGGIEAEVDPFSSAGWFDGWEHPPRRREGVATLGAPPRVTARTWLLRVGWTRHGLIDLTERPARVPA